MKQSLMIFYSIGFLGFILATLTMPALAPAADKPELPAPVSPSDWLPLLDHVDKDLEIRLATHLSKRREMRRLAADRKLAVGLVDLTDPAAPRYGQINGDVEMYAASLPKIAILLAAFDHFEKGLLERTPEVERDLSAMIRVSDNAAATRMIDRLGGLMQVNEVLRNPCYRFYDDENGGGLWVGKRYAKDGPRLPDPQGGISHAATVTQVCRFYYQLATGRLINQEASRDMLEMLSDPGIEHKFVKSLHERAPDADLYRKSGTWQRWHADSVLVWGPKWRRYILVALVESPQGERILHDLVELAENALKNPGGQ